MLAEDNKWLYRAYLQRCGWRGGPALGRSRALGPCELLHCRAVLVRINL